MKKLFTALFALSFAMVSCSDDKDYDENPDGGDGGGLTVTIDESPVGFPDTGGEMTLEMTATADWEVEGAVWWCEVTPSSGVAGTHTLTIKVVEELLPEDRSVTLTIGDKSVTVTQKRTGALILTQSEYEFESKGGVVVVKLKEMNFKTKVIEGQSWLTPIPFDEGITTHALSDFRTDSIKFIAYPNYTYSDRTGKILITDNYTLETDTVKVFQTKKDFVTNTETTKRHMWGSIASKTSSGDLTNINEYKQLYSKLLLSWRMLPDDTRETAFDVRRLGDGGWGDPINASPILTTNYQDLDADLNGSNSYRLYYHGETNADKHIDEYTISAGRMTERLPYISIRMKETASDPRLDNSAEYRINNVAVGDLTGDGNYELIVKRHASTVSSEDDDASNTTSASPVILEAYTLDGNHLWRLVFGPNISNSNGTVMVVADFNGDGVDEVAIRTSEGTVFDRPHTVAFSDYPPLEEVSGGYRIGDTNGDGRINYARPGYYNSEAPEFVSILQGATGVELARAPYIPIGTSEEWGDNYFKRANSLRLAGARLKSGNKWQIVACRGVYAKMVLQAWEYNGPGQAMTNLWTFDTEANNGYYKNYRGQGNHQLAVADVDGDGLDEITYGACAIDHDGRGLYTTKLGHGDMLHLGKFDPDRAGLQVFQCFESGTTKVALRDARTGKEIWSLHSGSPGDEGRCMIADIDPESPGYEAWAYNKVVHDINGQPTGGGNASATNFPIWFTGSLNRQLFDDRTIDQYNRNGGNARVFTMYRYPVALLNSTKNNACFIGDILGDWREEMVIARQHPTEQDSRPRPVPGAEELMIFSTWYPTEYKFPYLMSEDVYYRSAMHQNVGYNTPTQIGYYLGSDLVKDR